MVTLAGALWTDSVTHNLGCWLWIRIYLSQLVERTTHKRRRRCQHRQGEKGRMQANLVDQRTDEFSSIARWVWEDQVRDDGCAVLGEDLDAALVKEDSQIERAIAWQDQRRLIWLGEDSTKCGCTRLAAINRENSAGPIVANRGALFPAFADIESDSGCRPDLDGRNDLQRAATDVGQRFVVGSDRLTRPANAFPA